MAGHGNGKGSGYGPSIPLTRLYERVSKSGNHYLTGRLGAAKIVILKSSEVTDDGVPIWNVLLSEGPAPKAASENSEGEPQREANRPNTQRAQAERAADARADRRQPAQAERDEAARRDWQRSDLDDAMPF